MLSLFVCFVKDNIILDIAVVFGISMALAVLSGCITVVLLRTVLHPPGIGCSADTNGSTHDNYYCFKHFKSSVLLYQHDAEKMFI